MFPWIHRYLDISYLTQIGWDIGLRTLNNSVNAHKHACKLSYTCTDIIVMTGMSPRFCRYLYLPDVTLISPVIKILICDAPTEDQPTNTSIIYITRISGRPGTPFSSCGGLLVGLQPLWEAFGLFWGLQPLHRTWSMFRHVENNLEIP